MLAMESRVQQQSDAVVAAIERVLKAERDGVQKLQRSQDDAQRLLAEARAQASAIARRADACISKLHTAYLQKVQRDIDRLTQSAAAAGESTDKPVERAVLLEAARRVAAKLTGGP
jgi:vacuolar-type H+-ATPase subunit H